MKNPLPTKVGDMFFIGNSSTWPLLFPSANRNDLGARPSIALQLLLSDLCAMYKILTFVRRTAACTLLLEYIQTSDNYKSLVLCSYFNRIFRDGAQYGLVTMKV